jgi:PPK2 family polyphosphate:nucleotide phosphotransferase
MTELEGYPSRAPEGIDKAEIQDQFNDLQEQLFDLQNLLYANKKRSVLIILQGLDAAGKDSTIRHVFSCVNPMGCKVKSFKRPTEIELSHDFLWRIYPNLPAKGMMQIFNRSHYEDIIMPTINNTMSDERIEHRIAYIKAFEQHLQQHGTIILKFFLNISTEAQHEKIMRRLSDPKKKWKYDPSDLEVKAKRPSYIKVYEDLFKRDSELIPWEIIPADQKWYRNYLIAKSVVEKLESLKMSFPN